MHLSFAKKIFRIKNIRLVFFKALDVFIFPCFLIACSNSPQKLSSTGESLNPYPSQMTAASSNLNDKSEVPSNLHASETQTAQNEIAKLVQNQKSLSFENAYSEKIEQTASFKDEIDFRNLSKKDLIKNKSKFYHYLENKYKNQTAQTYLVQKNDTLQKISYQLFKTTRYWTELYILNSKKLRGFDSLKIKEIIWYKDLDRPL